MEGKTAACAHLSPVGNIAAAMADLWSNEVIVLRPDVVMELSKEILSVEGHFNQVKKAAEITIQLLKDARKAGKVLIEERELSILDTLQEQVAGIGNDEATFIEAMKVECDSTKFDPKKYDL